MKQKTTIISSLTRFFNYSQKQSFKTNFWKIGFFIELVVILSLSIFLIFSRKINFFLKKVEQESMKQKPGDLQEDWKTYRNKQYGFEFSYASKFNIVEDEDFRVVEPKTKGELFSRNHYLKIYDIYPIFEGKPGIFLQLLKTEKTIEEYLTEMKQYDLDIWHKYQQGRENIKESSAPQIISIDDVSSPQLEAKKIRKLNIDAGPNSQEIQFVFQRNGYIYVLFSKFARDWQPKQNKGEADTENHLTDDGIYYALESVFNSFKFVSSDSGKKRENIVFNADYGQINLFFKASNYKIYQTKEKEFEGDDFTGQRYVLDAPPIRSHYIEYWSSKEDLLDKVNYTKEGDENNPGTGCFLDDEFINIHGLEFQKRNLLLQPLNEICSIFT